MKVNLVYYSGSGHTEEMANILVDAMWEKGMEVNVFNEEVDSDFSNTDLMVFGSPACGTEEVDDTIIMPSIDAIGEFKDKKVFMFGSFGWGDGAYMDSWKELMEEKGAVIVTEPIVCLESPDDEAIEKLKKAVESF